MGWAIPKLTFSIREVVSDKLYKGGRRIHSQHRSLSWRQLFSYHVHQYYHVVRQLISVMWEHVVPSLLNLNSRIGHIYDVSFEAHDSELGDIVVKPSARVINPRIASKVATDRL